MFLFYSNDVQQNQNIAIRIISNLQDTISKLQKRKQSSRFDQSKLKMFFLTLLSNFLDSAIQNKDTFVLEFLEINPNYYILKVVEAWIQKTHKDRIGKCNMQKETT